MDLASILRQMESQQDFYTLANAPAIQLGRPSRPFLGPSLLPERQTDRNEWTEQAIRYRTFIANDGTRYSPPQRRPNGMIYGSMSVALGHQDVATDFTAKDYDELLRYLRQSGGGAGTMQAVADRVLRWTDTGLIQPLTTLMEKQRWDAIVNAQVIRVGDNGYTEVVNYPNPPGQRAAAGGQWTNDSYDLYNDIMAMVQLLTDKGYTASRFITSRSVQTKMLGNNTFAQRSGRVTVVGTNTLYTNRMSTADMNGFFVSEGMPTVELYDEVYFDLAGTHRFIPNNVFIIVATTGVDESIAYPNGEPLVIENILGYSAVGVAAGYDTPGRRVYVEAKSDKPPRLIGQAWQASFPVIMEPEAICVITGIS